MRKFKYLTVLSLPLTVVLSFNGYGLWTFLPLIVFFGFVPLIELLFPPDGRNMEENERVLAETDSFYDYLLYLMVPVQWGTLLYFLFSIQEPELSYIELAGRISSMGLMCGIIGINVGHELGHRKPGLAHYLGELLMLSSLENHFIPYHNIGHHFNVATPNDPATARRNESIYGFWLRSHFGSYRMAWSIEVERMKKLEKSWFSLENKMIGYTIAQLSLCTAIYIFFSWKVLLAFLLASIFGILLLETVNYIEHYGLLRQRNPQGRYERVRHQHSWNSDYVIGRLVLFELSRHSDHHYKASKKYQTLDSLDSSPQMPTGYPGMMLLALIPPLWFRYMNVRIDEFQVLKAS
jgi:alkane 1-monooxygenase